MKVSLQMLVREAEATGFRQDMLEKVVHLLGLLEEMQSHPVLRGKLALKGGTALNLFVFDVPRLSFDIDLNYIGSEEREEMLGERPRIEKALQTVFARAHFKVRRMPLEHAGGKWSLRYESALGHGGNLDVDLNFMFRLPLWPVTIRDSHPVGPWRALEVPVLDHAELAAGKLAALLARSQARDLFDAYQLFQMDSFDLGRLRIGFVVYGAMNRKDWRTVSVEDVDFDPTELARRLIPTLRRNTDEVNTNPAKFGKRILDACRTGLSALLPLTPAEQEFLDLLLDKGEIDSTLLTNDTPLQKRIQAQPGLAWKALNVRRHRGTP